MSDGPGHEFGFELRVCAWAERHWPPGEEPAAAREDRAVVVGRQMGTTHRRWDTVVVETTPELLERRAPFGEAELDSDLLHVVRNAPDSWAWYRDALPHPGYPWRHVREAVHRAADRNLVETRRGSNDRIELRRRWPYPDWAERVVAVENKPDLDASAARQLADQLRHDVAAGVADEVWVATTATGDTVEPVLLEDLPVEVGVLALAPPAVGDGAAEVDDAATAPAEVDDAATGSDDGSLASVEWLPRSLAVTATGTRIVERPSGGDRDRSAARFEYVDPATKAETRRVVAERAYGRGWRDYVETMRPDCRHFDLRRAGPGFVPHCAAKGREQTAAECAQHCPELAPHPPQVLQKGWPLEDSPGSTLRELLDERRRRRR